MTSITSAALTAPSTPGWYQTDVKSIDPEAQSLLEEYSGLQPDEVLPHVLALVSFLCFLLVFFGAGRPQFPIPDTRLHMHSFHHTKIRATQLAR